MVVAITACQKELTVENAGTGTGSGGGGGATPDTAYYIKFKLNGVAQDYRTTATALKVSFGAPVNIKAITVQARATSAIQPAIGIDVRDATDIVVNRTYDETMVNGTFSSLLYNNAAGETFSSAFTALPSGFECRFSEITTTYARGTFKGKTQSIGGTVSDITEGSFYVKIF